MPRGRLESRSTWAIAGQSAASGAQTGSVRNQVSMMRMASASAWYAAAGLKWPPNLLPPKHNQDQPHSKHVARESLYPRCHTRAGNADVARTSTVWCGRAGRGLGPTMAKVTRFVRGLSEGCHVVVEDRNNEAVRQRVTQRLPELVHRSDRHRLFVAAGIGVGGEVRRFRGVEAYGAEEVNWSCHRIASSRSASNKYGHCV